MVYYVRFLKTPRIQKQKGAGVTISTLVCITTDLGDTFLAQDVDLLVTLSLDRPEKTLYQETLQWKAGKRELPISLGPFAAQLSQQTVVMCVSAAGPGQPRQPSLNLLGKSTIPLVISGWSAPFGGAQSLVADKLVERRLGAKNHQLDLRIWEETGNSIARHIWDAAIASVIYLQQAIAGDPEVGAPLLQDLLQTPRSTPLHAIELGSGCGIVGIALAEILPQCSVLLTDLPEVEEIVTRNIAAAKPTPSSKIAYQTLDWDEKLPADLCDGHIDLILVSDCTYNADSLPALVSVLANLVQMSPSAIILVALKRRHDSERVFFDLMQSAGLYNLENDSMQLPSQHDQLDSIEFYCYGRKERHLLRSDKPVAAS